MQESDIKDQIEEKGPIKPIYNPNNSRKSKVYVDDGET